MSYSYGPTVVYPAFTMAEAFTGCYAPNAAKENNFAAFGAAPAAKVRAVVPGSPPGPCCAPQGCATNPSVPGTRRRPSWCSRRAAAATARGSR